MNKLPEFNFVSYKSLLKELLQVGYRFKPISELPEYQVKTVYLRHDVDAFLSELLPFARFESEVGIQATYYVLLSQHYNVFTSENREIISELVEFGHEIGLHYDLANYPEQNDEAREWLEFEVSVLERISGQRIKTISMHNPRYGRPDIFNNSDDYVHPHDQRYLLDLSYVTDSCYSWQDAKLLECFSTNPPLRLLLLTHLEGWLSDGVSDRNEYLEKTMLPISIKPQRRFFLEEVPGLLAKHPAVKVHDERNSKFNQK